MSGIFTPDPNRSAEARIMFELGYIKAQTTQILAQTSTPKPKAGFWGWLDRLQSRLGFLATAYRTFRLVPWGLLFLAAVAAWKFVLRLFA